MTSPVDTSVKFFSSAMVGAPVLTRAAGSLVALLDALLVNGWNALSLTSLSVANGIATAGFNGTFAGLPDSVVEISGATGAYAVLNGEQKLLSNGAGFVTFATAAPNGSAAGTLGMKMAAAGWTKPFAATNVGVYRSGETTGNRFFLRVNDAAVKEARVIGYETMTAVSTGTNLFPTSAQINGGLYWTKSVSEDASATPWFLVANGRRFYIGLAMAAGTFSGGAYDAKALYGFGEFPTLKATPDAYNTLIAGCPAAGTGYGSLATLSAEPGNELFIARLHTNAVGARAATWGSAWGTGSGYVSGQATQLNGPVTPSAISRLMMVTNLLYIDRSVHGPRGTLPELALIPQGVPVSLGIAELDRVPGVGALAGRKLAAFFCQYNPVQTQPSDGTYRSTLLLDVTGPWS
jgi:hypothetical protein